MTLSLPPDIKTFYLESLGCAKNQVDSEVIISALKDKNLKYLLTPEEADIIIVNTCGFIEPAKKEAIETLFSFKNQFPEKIVIGTGCFVQRYNKDLTTQMGEIDGFIGNDSPENFAEALIALLNQQRKYLPTTPSPENAYCQRTENLSYPRSRYVKIGEGCSNWCRYCAIPLIRGELKSRTVNGIVTEIKDLLKEGTFEICLISQDLANYGKDLQEKPTLADLLTEISRITGDFWIRLLYIHPDHFPMNILPIIKRDSRFLPYFDIPFQHASAPVLKKMGRNGDPEVYSKLIETIREEIPEAAIRTTLMTGFPSESKKDFETLLDFQEKIQAEWLGVFCYSREKDTAAYSDKKRIPERIKEKRKEIIEERQTAVTEKSLGRFIGKETKVLIETPIENEELSIGRTVWQAPEVDGLTVVHGKFSPGDVVPVKIVALNGVDWEALPL